MDKEKHLLNNWVNHNRDLVKKYRYEWIAFTLDGIIAHSKDLSKLTKQADKLTDDYLIYFVSKYFGKVRFLPVKFKSIKTHEWSPEYEVSLKFGKIEKRIPILVDSGADFSLINKNLGIELGYKIAAGEPVNIAIGISGTIQYVLRNIEITIDNHSFTAPVAWVQDEDCTDVILGREIVFDLFDIEFKQAEEKIIFRKRNI